MHHSVEKWDLGDVHTNSIEDVCSRCKRSIVGAFKNVSERHRNHYLEEMEWLFNTCNNPHMVGDTLIRIVRNPAMRYKERVDGKFLPESISRLFRVIS